MLIKEGAILYGLQPVMRQVLRESELIWKELGRPEGITVTEGTGGVHSAASFHYYGLAVDLRTNYSSHNLGQDINKDEAESLLRLKLPEFDIIVHSSHIHIEVSDRLAERLGVMY